MIQISSWFKKEVVIELMIQWKIDIWNWFGFNKLQWFVNVLGS